MVVTGASGSGSLAHQARQRLQGVHGRVDAPRMQFAGQYELALRDVAGEIGDRVGDVATRHRQHGQHGHRPRQAANASAALVEGGEVAVQVAGVRAASRDLASCGGHLAQRLAVAGHVRHDDEHVAAKVEGQVLGDGERDARRQDALDDGIVGGVHEQHELSRARTLLEPVPDGGGVGMGQAHRREHDAERIAADAGLCRNLRGELEVRQAGSGEDRQLLPADERGHPVYRGHPRDDRVGGRLAHERVQGGTGCGGRSPCRGSPARRRAGRRGRCTRARASPPRQAPATGCR